MLEAWVRAACTSGVQRIYTQAREQARDEIKEIAIWANRTEPEILAAYLDSIVLNESKWTEILR